jgi:sulfatase modifying factor 1
MNRPHKLLTYALVSVTGFAAISVSGQTWTNSLDMKFVRVAAGEFIQGSPVSEPERSTNEVQRKVAITKPFWLGATHVTVGQFTVFTKASSYQTAAEKQGWASGAWDVAGNKWHRLEGGSWRNPGFGQGTNHPVVCVTWHDANAFCDWLSKKEGRKYRLPTEAEWEYASRAGQTTAYLWGNNPDGGQGWVNCSDQTSSNLFTLFPPFTWSDGFIYTSPVATFRPNAWGLYDMLGNALQWCGDWYGTYPTNAVDNPQGSPVGKERVLRGGAFIYGPRHCRCAFRGRNLPDFQNYYVGFRVLLETEAETKATP